MSFTALCTLALIATVAQACQPYGARPAYGYQQQPCVVTAMNPCAGGYGGGAGYGQGYGGGYGGGMQSYRARRSAESSEESKEVDTTILPTTVFGDEKIAFESTISPKFLSTLLAKVIFPLEATTIIVKREHRSAESSEESKEKHEDFSSSTFEPSSTTFEKHSKDEAFESTTFLPTSTVIVDKMIEDEAFSSTFEPSSTTYFPTKLFIKEKETKLEPIIEPTRAFIAVEKLAVKDWTTTPKDWSSTFETTVFEEKHDETTTFAH